jgi:hypothetical protein
VPRPRVEMRELSSFIANSSTCGVQITVHPFTGTEQSL